MVQGLQRKLWVGLVAAAVYVLIAGWFGEFVGGLAAPGDANAEFALGHFVPLTILIVGALVFLRWAGWSKEVWSSPSVIAERRRWWMLAIPALLAVQIAVGLVSVPWDAHAASTVLIVLAGTIMVGIGEELYFRGILRTAVLGHHGEFLALLITSVAFGLGHTVKFLLLGMPIEALAFQIAFLAMDGALFYGALRATGTLWVPIALHALNDFQLYIHSGDVDGVNQQTFGEDPLTVTSELILIALSVALVVSTIRNDRRRDPAEPVNVGFTAKEPLES